MPMRTTTIVALAVGTSLVLAATRFHGALNGGDPCADINVVGADDPSMTPDTICQAAAAATAFLAANGLQADGPVRMRVVPSLPEAASDWAYGYFDSRDQWIYLLDYSASQRVAEEAGGAGIFRLPMDVDLYRGIVAHEVAHAVASGNFTNPDPPRAAQEYIAYVTQLATLAPATRELVLTDFPGRGFSDHRSINSVTLMMSPDNFAVGVYRHFLRPDNGSDFFDDLLTERVRVDYGLW